MVTCSFLCDAAINGIVDEDFEPKLRAYMSRLLMEHDGLEFFIQHSCHARAILVLCAILEAKQAYPDKCILLTLVGGKHIRERVCETNELSLPACIFDRIIQLSIDEKRDRSSHIEKWLIAHSDFLFCYSYQDLQFDRHRLLYNYAKRVKDLVIIDLANLETVHFLRNSMSKLPPDKQYLKKQLDNGVSQDTIMREMKLTAYKFRKEAAKIPVALIRYALTRFHEQIGRDTTLPPSICSIMDFHPQTPVSEEKIQSIEKIISFLVHDFGIALFVVEQSMCNAKMVSIIKETIRKATRYCSKRAIISVAAPYLGPKKWGKVKDKYVPSFDSVLPFIPRGSGPEQKIRMQASLLCMSDFVIYDGQKDQEPFAALVNEASERKDFASRLKVLDISRTAVEIKTL